jgi:hypothetical protein
MDDPTEHALVIKAFANARGSRRYVTGYVEWIDDRAAAIAREKLAELAGLTPEAIRTMAIDLVNDGLEVIQSRETRETWSEFRFKYIVKIPLEGIPSRVFVELRLNDSDPDDPVVHIVSAHRDRV